MTTGKPPQLPPKTVLGVPGDAPAAKQKSQAPGAPPVQPDFQRTLLGNPHAAPGPAPARPSSAVPPRLPQSQPFRPPPAGAQPPPTAMPQTPGLQSTQYKAPSTPAAAPMARTQFVGQSAQPSTTPSAQSGPMARTQFAGPSGQPGATPSAQSGPMARTQFAEQSAAPGSTSARAPGSSGPPPLHPQRAAPAQPSAAAPAVRPGQSVVVTGSQQPPAAENSRSGVQPTAAQPSAPKVAPAAASNPAPSPTSASARGPAFGSTEPDRERDSNRPAAQAAVPSALKVDAGAPGSVAPGAPKLPDMVPPAGGMMATRLVTFEPGALPSQSSIGAARTGAASETPRLSLNAEDRTERTSAPVKRWPALSLLALAIVAFGGVIVVRAPQLLPEPLMPLAAMVVDRLRLVLPPATMPASVAQPGTPSDPNQPGSSAVPDQPEMQGVAPAQPGAVPDQPVMQGAGPAQPGAVPDQPVMQGAEPAQPGAIAPDQPETQAVAPTAVPGAEGAQPVAPVAAPPTAAQGAVAELEKQAIDLLLANDYPAAHAVYERLRAAEPARSEYSMMLEMLAREVAAACGGPEQAPCEPQP